VAAGPPRRLPDLTRWRIGGKSPRLVARPTPAASARLRAILAGELPACYGGIDIEAMQADPAYRAMMAACEQAERRRGAK
jgi:hypothetical protein